MSYLLDANVFIAAKNLHYGFDFCPALFRPTDTKVAEKFADVSAWATSQRYEAGAITTFFQAADYYLIAHGLAGGHTIVTHETPSPSVKKIKIPDACVGLQIRFMTPYQMLRLERARFVLGDVRR